MGLLDIDHATFHQCFDVRPFTVKHNLVDHPLFSSQRLIELAKLLPDSNVEYNAGTIPINADPEMTPRTGLSIEETMRRIEECQSWMALKYVEADPEYRALLHACVEEVQHHAGPLLSKIEQCEAFIFLSSPGSITPYHMDPEHNFLLQIRGKKFIKVFNRTLVPQQCIERFYCGAHRNLPFDASWEEEGTTFELQSGNGVHVPVEAPHYVRNGPNVSVSFSITFRTPDLDRRRSVHIVNNQFRKIGLGITPIGDSPLLDAAKSVSYRAYRKARSVLGKRA